MTTSAETPTLTPKALNSASIAARWPARWCFWRSPADQPRWARPALLGVAACAAVMFGYQVFSNTGINQFYAAAARSMSRSWHAFFYGSLDPAGSITIDKLPGFLWPQALSARVLGFHTWSLALPEAIEGIVTVLVLYRLVTRWAGAVAGLIAAGVFVFTPVIAAVFGQSGMEDNALTMLLVLAADAWFGAVRTGRLRMLLLSGVWVGLAFQTKMVEAWAVLPAFAVGYFVAAPPRARTRLAHLLAAGVVTVAVSLSWMIMVQLTPAKDRPYVDGSTNNNVFSMVFGYNALGRFGSLGLSANGTGSVPGFGGGGGHHTAQQPTDLPTALSSGSANQLPTGGSTAGGASGDGTSGAGLSGGRSSSRSGAGSAPAGLPNSLPNGLPNGVSGGVPGGGGQAATLPASGGAPRGGFGGAGGGGVRSTWLKLFNPTGFATQVGWLYPAAFAGLAAGIVAFWRRPRQDLDRVGYLMWGSWIAVIGFAFSAGTVPHSHYTSVLAPAIAALTGAGAVLMARAWRAGGGLLAGWAPPVTVAATVGWAAYLSSHYGSFLPWLTPLVIGVGVAGVALLVFLRLTRQTRTRLAVVALTAGLLAAVASPAAWALSVFDPTYRDSGINANAGPYDGGFGGGMNSASRDAGRGFGGAGSGHQASQRYGQGFGGPAGDQPGRAGQRLGRGRFAGGGAPFGTGGRGGTGGPFGGSTTPTAQQSALISYLTAHRDGARYLMAVAGSESAASYIVATGASILPMGGFSGSAPSPTLAQFQHLVSSGQLHYVLTSQSGMGGMMGRGAATADVTSWVTAHCTLVPNITSGTLYRC